MNKQIIFGDSVQLEVDLPIQNLIALKITHQVGQHSQLQFQVMIEIHNQTIFFQSAVGMNVKVFDIRENHRDVLFTGRIKMMEYQKENQFALVDLCAFSHSYELDLKPKCCSFQNPEWTFEQLAEMVLKESDARFLWNTNEGVSIRKPIIQYQETDWQFLTRLASHFHTYLQVSCTSNRPDFCFGIEQGKKRELEAAELYEFGFAKDYYNGSGYVSNHPQEMYQYLKIESLRRWGIGDAAFWSGNKFTVYQEEIQIEKGELRFKSILGAAGFLYQDLLYNSSFQGLKLKGTIKNVEKDCIYFQFDFDAETRADYPWPWTPEISNFGYCMPEVNETAILMFPDECEGNGQGTHLLKNTAVSQKDQYRELSTIDNKTLGLYPDKIFFQGVENILSLEDGNGILINSAKRLSLKAQNGVTLTARGIQMQAPQHVSFQADESNIELSKDINFYASEGVSSSGSNAFVTKAEQKSRQQEYEIREKEHWQLSYHAMAAVPKVELSGMKPSGIHNLTTCGAVPKLAKITSVKAMEQILTGKKTTDTVFSKAFLAMSDDAFYDEKPMIKDEMTNVEGEIR